MVCVGGRRSSLGHSVASAEQARRARLRDKQRRKWTARGLWLAAAVVGVTHLLSHLGAFQVLPSAAAQDLLIGYPTAAVLAVTGLVVLGP